jgi:hypothetical protein
MFIDAVKPNVERETKFAIQCKAWFNTRIIYRDLQMRYRDLGHDMYEAINRMVYAWL